MLNKLNKDKEENEENVEKNDEEEKPNVVLRGVKKVLGKTTPAKLNIKKEIPEPFDMTFDLEEQYFYKEIPNDEWEEINTFLETYDMKGKTIIPFATSGGSGMGNTNEELKEYCEGAELKDGKVFNRSVSEDELREWIDNI